MHGNKPVECGRGVSTPCQNQSWKGFPVFHPLLVTLIHIPWGIAVQATEINITIRKNA